MTSNSSAPGHTSRAHIAGVETKRSLTLFNESGIHVPFSELDLDAIVQAIEKAETCRYNEIEVVFVSEQEILQINQHYLSHNYVTDIITFPYESQKSDLEGTLYCCAAQIERQSDDYGTSYREETCRVVIHGLLHLAGYTDDSVDTKAVMSGKEQFFLNVTHIIP